jgi:LPS export ABC transporter protein LptC
MPVQEAWDSTIITSKNGNKTAEIHFGYMSQYEKEKVFYFGKGIEVDIFNNEGQHVSNAVADSGVLNEVTEDIEAHGNVVAISDSGSVLKTERMFWNNANQKWYSDAPTMYIPSEGDTLRSIGFESDKYFENYQGYKLQMVSKSKVDLNFEDRLKPKSDVKDTSAIIKTDSLLNAKTDTVIKRL